MRIPHRRQGIYASHPTPDGVTHIRHMPTRKDTFCLVLPNHPTRSLLPPLLHFSLTRLQTDSLSTSFVALSCQCSFATVHVVHWLSQKGWNSETSLCRPLTAYIHVYLYRTQCVRTHTALSTASFSFDKYFRSALKKINNQVNNRNSFGFLQLSAIRSTTDPTVSPCSLSQSCLIANSPS